MSERDWQAAILAARERIASHVRWTPLEHSLVLSDMAGGQVYIKLESEQLTGAFKVRGAFNAILKLKAEGKLGSGKGPTIASTGNHALACNYALGKLGLEGVTYASTLIDPSKEATLKRMGAKLVKVGTDCLDGELAARKAAQDEGRVYVSPYNNYDVVAGQGTIGYEIYEDLRDVDAVFVPVGGGGLISGIATYLKAVKPSVKIIGCSPAASRVMHESIKAGKIIFMESEETLSSATAGALEENSVTFELCRDHVDDWLLVSEDEIADAVYFMVQHHHKIVEGATGVALGAFMKNIESYRGKNVVIIGCGGNMAVDTLRDILNRKK